MLFFPVVCLQSRTSAQQGQQKLWFSIEEFLFSRLTKRSKCMHVALHALNKSTSDFLFICSHDDTRNIWINVVPPEWIEYNYWPILTVIEVVGSRFRFLCCAWLNVQGQKQHAFSKRIALLWSCTLNTKENIRKLRITRIKDFNVPKRIFSHFHS